MDFKEKWITDGLEAEAVSSAKELGEKLAGKGVSTSQIRNVFGEIKKIQALGMDKEKGRSRLYMIAPKLAYSIGRLERRDEQKREALTDLLTNVESAVKWIDKGDATARFNHFVDYMEAVVAYHKFKGGNN